MNDRFQRGLYIRRWVLATCGYLLFVLLVVLTARVYVGEGALVVSVPGKASYTWSVKGIPFCFMTLCLVGWISLYFPRFVVGF
jgi:hypothetical protein